MKRIVQVFLLLILGIGMCCCSINCKGNRKPIQWALSNDGSLIDLTDEEIHAVRGVDINYCSIDRERKRDAVIAILDSGINTNSKYLSNIWLNTQEIPDDNMDNDKNGYIDDYSGWNFRDDSPDIRNKNESDMHGTFVCSVLTSQLLSATGVLSETDNHVMELKVVNEEGEGNIEDVIEAIAYAEKNGATVCNMSFSTYQNNERLKNCINNSKMLFVTAAGNESEKLSDRYKIYPACWKMDNLIVVGSCRCDGNISNESNYGIEYVDILAPGTDVVGLDNEDEPVYQTGTSFAVPYVSGLASILYAYSDELLEAEELKKLIVNNARYIVGGNKVLSGGMVDYKKTIDELFSKMKYNSN